MAIAFGSSAQTVGTAHAATLTVSVPSGTVDGDLLLLVGINDYPAQYTTPTGWTQLEDAFNPSWADCAIWWRTASSEPASYDLTAAGGYCSLAAIVRYTGASGIRAHSQVKSTAAGTTSPAASVPTGVTATDMVVHCFGFVGSGTTPGAVAVTGPASPWTTRLNPCTSVANDYQVGLAVADQLGATTGPTASAGTSAWWVTPSVALTAASAPPPVANSGAFLPFFF